MNAVNQKVIPVTLRGEITRLEPMEENHIGALTEVGSDESIWRYTVSPASNAETMRSYVLDALKDYGAGRALPFVTIHNNTNTIIGSTRFGNIDLSHKRVEIGWTWITPSWQRTGVNTEVKLLLLQHAFEVLGCERVEFKTDAINLQSRNALKRIGAKEEGILRRHMLTSSGRWRDSVYFSIVKDEWPEVRAHIISLQSKHASHESK